MRWKCSCKAGTLLQSAWLPTRLQRGDERSDLKVNDYCTEVDTINVPNKCCRQSRTIAECKSNVDNCVGADGWCIPDAIKESEAFTQEPAQGKGKCQAKYEDWVQQERDKHRIKTSMCNAAVKHAQKVSQEPLSEHIVDGKLALDNIDYESMLEVDDGDDKVVMEGKWKTLLKSEQIYEYKGVPCRTCPHISDYKKALDRQLSYDAKTKGTSGCVSAFDDNFMAYFGVSCSSHNPVFTDPL